jgi:hypothetical protein
MLGIMIEHAKNDGKLKEGFLFTEHGKDNKPEVNSIIF